MGKGPEQLSPNPTKELSAAQIKALERRGYRIMNLDGRSLRDCGNEVELWSRNNYQNPSRFNEFYDRPSLPGQIAIRVKDFPLPKTGELTLEEQLKVLEDYSTDIARKIPGVKAVMGSSSDYVQIAIAYFKKTGQRLLGWNGREDPIFPSLVRTSDTIVGYSATQLNNISVGYFDNNTMEITEYKPEDRLSLVKIAPIVVPA